MVDDRLELTRRKILAGSGVVGLAGAGAGLGTSAFFSDQESFTNNQFVAGELDMKVSWEEHYSDWKGDEQDVDGVRMVESTGDLRDNEVGLPSYDDPMLAVPTADTDGDGTAQVDEFMEATLQERFPDKETRNELEKLPPGEDPCEVLADVPEDLDNGGEARPLIDLEDVKPGDFGEVTFDFTICDNPGLVWLTGGLVEASENGSTEPEREDEQEKEGVVELLDELQVTVWYDSGNNILEDTETYVTQRSVDDQGNPSSSAVNLTGDHRIVTRGTLREVLADLSTGRGIPLDGIPIDTPRDCFAPTPTIHYLGVSWELPVDHGNEVQTDSVTFDLGFDTEQCRHNNSGTTTALVEGSPGENDEGETLRRLDLVFDEQVDLNGLEIEEITLNGDPIPVQEVKPPDGGRWQLLFFSDREEFANNDSVDLITLLPEDVYRILLGNYPVDELGTIVEWFFNPDDDEQDDESGVTEPEAEDED